jgi:iron complex transport system substrate-binding protein
MNLFRIILIAAALSAGFAHAADCPRIVSQSPYITRALEWLGLAPCIVGVSRYDRRKELPSTGGVIDPDARGMAEVEAKLADIDARVDRFATDWRAAAARIDGRQRRALIMSACGKAPYSYGKGTTLHELFTAAGFEIVADHDNIRNFRPDEPDDDAGAWIAERQPALIFALKNSLDEACNPDIARAGVMIVPLEGEHFTQPGPGLLDGLEELRKIMRAIDVPPASAS